MLNFRGVYLKSPKIRVFHNPCWHITSSGSWWSPNLMATHTKNRTKDCSNVASFKQLFFFRFLQNDITFREKLVPDCWWNIRFGSGPISVTHAEIWGGLVVGWEGAISTYLDLNWMKPWMVKKCHCKGVNWMEVTKTEGFSGSFSRYGFGYGFLQAVRSKQFLRGLGCEVLGVFFWSVRFSQKMEITRRLVFELQWKGLHGAYVICVFFFCETCG